MLSPAVAVLRLGVSCQTGRPEFWRGSGWYGGHVPPASAVAQSGCTDWPADVCWCACWAQAVRPRLSQHDETWHATARRGTTVAVVHPLALVVLSEGCCSSTATGPPHKARRDAVSSFPVGTDYNSARNTRRGGSLPLAQQAGVGAAVRHLARPSQTPRARTMQSRVLEGNQSLGASHRPERGLDGAAWAAGVPASPV